MTSHEPAPLTVGLDVGGTTIKTVLLDADGSVLLAGRRDTAAAAGPEAVIKGIVTYAQAFTARCEAQFSRRVGAVGLAVPGIVDDDSGIAVYAANLGWHDVPIRALLAARIDADVTLTQDVRAGALAEARLGAAVGHSHSLFVPLGTGLAGVLVVDGVPYRGGQHGGGELGHVVVRPGGRVCACGARGCLETVSSAGAIVRNYAEATGTMLTAQQVVQLARSADPIATAVWDDAIDALAAGLMACIALADPTIIVIGGGLALAGETLFVPLRARVAERASYHSVPPIIPGALGASAGAIGAALAAATRVPERQVVRS